MCQARSTTELCISFRERREWCQTVYMALHGRTYDQSQYKSHMRDRYFGLHSRLGLVTTQSEP